MNIKKILINAGALVVLFVILMFAFSTHSFDNMLNLVGIGVPMWTFLSLVVLIIIAYYLSTAVALLRSINDRLNQPQYYPEEYPENEQD